MSNSNVERNGLKAIDDEEDENGYHDVQPDQPKSLYVFEDVEAKRAKPHTITQAVKDVLRANHSACYVEMEKYLRSPGVCGSRYFDQANAVRILRKHDKKLQGRLSKIRKKGSLLTDIVLWGHLQTALKQAGFDVKRGQIVGLLSYEATDKPDVA